MILFVYTYTRLLRSLTLIPLDSDHILPHTCLPITYCLGVRFCTRCLDTGRCYILRYDFAPLRCSLYIQLRFYVVPGTPYVLRLIDSFHGCDAQLFLHHRYIYTALLLVHVVPHGSLVCLLLLHVWLRSAVTPTRCSFLFTLSLHYVTHTFTHLSCTSYRFVPHGFYTRLHVRAFPICDFTFRVVIRNSLFTLFCPFPTLDYRFTLRRFVTIRSILLHDLILRLHVLPIYVYSISIRCSVVGGIPTFDFRIRC